MSTPPTPTQEYFRYKINFLIRKPTAGGGKPQFEENAIASAATKRQLYDEE